MNYYLIYLTICQMLIFFHSFNGLNYRSDSLMIEYYRIKNRLIFD